MAGGKIAGTLLASGLAFALFGHSSAYAQRAAIFDSARAAYFATELYALPIILPQEDAPGDIYIDPIRKFQFRGRDCFPEARIGSTVTSMPAYLSQSQRSLGIEFSGGIPELAEALVGTGLTLEDDFQISFSDASAQDITWSQISSVTGGSSEECRAYIANTLSMENVRDPFRSIPWILATVIEARETYAFRSLRNISINASAQADLVLRIQGLPVPVEIDPSLDLTNGSTRTVLVNSESEYPVAYRPMFISLEDMERLAQIEDGGLIHALRQFFKGTSDFETIEAIRSEFPDDFRYLGDTLDAMTNGPGIEFEEEDEAHRVYLERAGLMVAGGLAADRMPEGVEYSTGR